MGSRATEAPPSTASGTAALFLRRFRKGPTSHRHRRAALRRFRLHHAERHLKYVFYQIDLQEFQIDDNIRVGVGVPLLTADHPDLSEMRSQGLENGRPVRNAGNVRGGGGALPLHVVTVDADRIIASGGWPGAMVRGKPARA